MDEKQREGQSELSEELRMLGQRLREAVAAIREGQQAQEFSQELRRGLIELRAEIDEVLESNEVQRLGESVREAVHEIGQGDVGQQIRKGVLAALKEINAHIERIIQEAEEAQAEEESPSEESSHS